LQSVHQVLSDLLTCNLTQPLEVICQLDTCLLEVESIPLQEFQHFAVRIVLRNFYFLFLSQLLLDFGNLVLLILRQVIPGEEEDPLVVLSRTLVYFSVIGREEFVGFQWGHAVRILLAVQRIVLIRFTWL